MKFIYYSLITPVLFLCLFSPLFAGHREGQKDLEAKAREELKKTTNDVLAKQEEIRKKEEEIKQKKEIRDEAGEKRAQDELVTLNKEMQESLDAKIKATNDILDFKPADSVSLKVEKEIAANEKLNIEKQIKKLEAELALEGTTITIPSSKISESEFALGQRIGKNFEIWVTSKLIKISEAFGNYEFAMYCYESLADLYGELNKPLQRTENLLAADRLSFKLSGLTSKIQESRDILETYLYNLQKINLEESQKLKKSTTATDKEKIKNAANAQREKALGKNNIKNIAMNVLELRNELVRIKTPEFAKSVDMSEKTLAAKLDRLNSQVDNLVKKMNLEAAGLGPRTEAERKKDALQVEKNAKSLLTDPMVGKLNEVLGRKITGYGKGESDFSAMMFYLTDLEKLNYSLLVDPNMGEKITNILGNSYQKIQDAYADFILGDAFKKLPKDKQLEIQKRLIYFGSKAKRFQLDHSYITKEIELRNKFTPEERKTYELLVSKNKNATIVNSQRLEIAESALGKDKVAIQDMLQTIAFAKDSPEKLDTLVKNFDEKIKKIYLEIFNQDPSQRSVDSLQRILNTLSDIMTDINSNFLGKDLSPEAAKALTKAYLKMNIRFQQLSSEMARDQGSLTVIVGNNVVALPQVIRANIKEMQTISSEEPRSSKSTTELAKSMWGSASNRDQQNIDQQNALIDQIDKVSLKSSDFVAKNEGEKLVEVYVQSVQAKKSPEGQSASTISGSGSEWDI